MSGPMGVQEAPQLIHINYDELFRGADEVDQRASNLQQAGLQVMNVSRQVTTPSVWAGLAARAFYVTASLYVRFLSDIVANLHEASAALRRYGREMQAEEDRQNAEIRRRFAELAQLRGLR